MTKMDGMTPDIAEENIAKLKQLFPEICCEDKVDLEKLKQVLGEYVDDDTERYNFTWNGKGQTLKLSQTPSMGTLRPCREKSKNWDDTDNLYIEGDNLEVLKLLQKSYYGKVKMIYIDPPYNTGNDFVYKDDFKDGIENYKTITGQLDDLGHNKSSRNEISGRYHTDWLNMIYPRLRIARNLLTDDGVIFISIDDNESGNLRYICNEIFGEDNYLECFHIQVRYGNKSLNEKDNFQKLIEEVLIYAKDKKKFVPHKPYEQYNIAKFCNEIIELESGNVIELGGKKVTVFKPGQYKITKHNQGSLTLLKDTWATGSVLKGNTSGKFFDKYLGSRKEKDGVGCLYKVEGIGEDGLGYRYFTGPKKESATKGQFYSGVPISRLDDLERGIESRKYRPIINYYDYSADFGNIRTEGNVDFRTGKKPVKMIRHFLDIVGDKEGLYMDFFSGSASTAHAIMQANADDGGHRKFIMVQLPEIIKKDEDYYRAGFHNICEIGEKRISNVGEEIKQNYNENKQLTIDNKAVELPDIGFKVFELDSSNIKKWQPDDEQVETTLLSNIDNFVPERTEIDVVYEIMLKLGIDLSYHIEEKEIVGGKIYLIGIGSLMICLDDDITTEMAEAMIKLHNELQPEIWKVVFKDNGFKDDGTKINVLELFKSAGLDEDAFTTI